MSTVGILLPCDGSEPLPISVGDYLHIQQLVGGHFDCVRYDMDADRFPDAPSAFTAIGYVHDEGLLIGLEPNIMASLMFDRHLVGDVVVVSGTSPKGEYDGDNHDVPSWFADLVFGGSLRQEAQEMHDVASLSAIAVEFAYKDGLLDDELFMSLVALMRSDDAESDDTVANVLEMCIVYMTGRLAGMPAVTREDMERRGVERLLGDTLESVLSDEAIASFINNQEGK